MQDAQRLLMDNKAWASEMTATNPEFFHRMADHQSPDFLWIGCSDSRVPAEITVKAKPGEIFVHRNIGNQIIATDFNCLGVVQYAVRVLKVKHIIVCGHYGCGGIKAALHAQQPYLNLVNNWLMHIKDTYRMHEEDLEPIECETERVDRLVEYNIIEQVYRLANLPVIQQAWQTDGIPTLHGWVYGLGDGLLNELITLDLKHTPKAIYQLAR